MSIMGCKDKMEGYSSMSKKKGEGLKSFNKGFSVPDTYIIIFFVVVLAAIVTFFVINVIPVLPINSSKLQPVIVSRIAIIFHLSSC